MTEQEVEKLQRGIEAALRDLRALTFGATIQRGQNGATVIVTPKPGFESRSQQKEQQDIADALRLALIERGYRVTSDVMAPSRDGESYSFTIRGR